MKKNRKLKIVFDTNAIHTGSESFLFNRGISEFIKSNSKHFDIDISWHLPEMVIQERNFQMIKKGNELLPAIHKVETLLGQSVNLDKKIIEKKIKERIKNQLTEHSVSKSKLKPEKVDWKSIIFDSVNRIPPFENGENEKGFRDAIILETFNQIVESSPKTPSICILVFYSDDKLLIEALEQRMLKRKNVRIINDLPQLKGLINTLVSDIEESLINTISEAASKLFFVQKQESSLYYKKEIRSRINEEFSIQLSEKPDEITTAVEQGTWFISKVSFIKKEKQRIFWNSPISVDLIASKLEDNYLSNIRIGISDLKNTNKSDDYLKWFSPKVDESLSQQLISKDYLSLPPRFSSSNYLQNYNRKEHRKGSAKFTVTWSVTYGVNKKLLTPKIIKIEHIENQWGS